MCWMFLITATDYVSECMNLVQQYRKRQQPVKLSNSPPLPLVMKTGIYSSDLFLNVKAV